MGHLNPIEGHWRRFRVALMVLILVAALTVVRSSPVRAQEDSEGSTLTVRSAVLPVPFTADEDDDPSSFTVAGDEVVLHEIILLPG